jgi:hypothetical protein
MYKPTPRRDDTQLRLHVVSPKSDAETLHSIAHMVRDALQARASLVGELGEGVEYEAQLARERLVKQGIDADLSAIRIGEYFKRMTEFNMLQRLHRVITNAIEGRPASDKLGPDGDDG